MTTLPAIIPAGSHLPALTGHRHRLLTSVNEPVRRDRLQESLDGSMSESTQRVYRYYWQDFSTWCDVVKVSSMPAEPQYVESYLWDMADNGTSASSINSARAAINKAHQVYAAAHPDEAVHNPTADDRVKIAVKAIRRKIGTAQRQKAPLLPGDIRAMIDTLDLAGMQGKRDKALILLEFFTACRRAEIAALTTLDVSETLEGLLVTIRKSKTDQEGVGREVGITRQDNPAYCPVRALMAYLKAGAITSGPLFRGVYRSGRLRAGGLTGHAISAMVKQVAEDAGLDPEKYSSHSLRSGLVTSAFQGGATIAEIMLQTGHKSTDTVMKYARKANIFKETVTRKIKL